MCRLTSTLLFLLLTTACRNNHVEEAVDPIRLRPAGQVTTLRSAERYLLFESHFSFMPGVELRAVRAGRPVARLRVLSVSRPPLYAADILSGDVRVGDLVEPRSTRDSGRQ